MPLTAVGTMGRGVLHPGLAAARFRLARYQPSAGLAPFVDYYWIPRWDLRGEPPYQQTILPHPNVHLVFEASGAGIFGVDRNLFTRSLSGLGLALGVRFRAGGFRPFWQAPISQLTDRVVPAALLFGPRAEQTRQVIMRADLGSGGVSDVGAGGDADADAGGDVDAGWDADAGGDVDVGWDADAGGDVDVGWDADAGGDADAGWDADSDAGMIEAAEELLFSVLPARGPVAEQAADMVACIVADPALRRVDHLSAASGLTARSLQRLFADYVGVSPKWVMRRARLHEAAERADSGEIVDWAALAADLGYADQAHLTRDFTVTIGVPPTRYAKPAGSASPATPVGRLTG